MSDLRTLRGIIRRVNNIIFGYKKPTGRKRRKKRR